MANIRLGDVPTWYEELGEGEPLVLLHGGFVDSRMFAPALPVLDDRFRVFTVDRRGHGRTSDVEGPISYELMAQDMIAFLEQVVGGPAHLVGHSDGANVAMIVAMRRPDLVRRLVLVSGNYHHDGIVPGVLEGFTDEGVLQLLAPRYGEVSPDGEKHFPVVVEKLLRMVFEEPTLTEDDLGRITGRTLVVAGDDDAVTLEHTIALYRAIPDAELAIVPGTSHLLVVEKPDQVYTLIADFLANDPVPTWQPIRRARSEYSVRS
ncbi:alpha/beta fold hydrolase [Nonomuraea zeae]|uniref:Alpha/beta fold hydrolase n=1 Tax=Nonomuraea zeae TaxID=1642303 RepID=A0A5S4H122_9ACTN|nr:alpha/beta hydrolase [Nonomuraea zeae]TMR38401.1 alpha/beta fold hydrolase [Nonomuraea zeae]